MELITGPFLNTIVSAIAGGLLTALVTLIRNKHKQDGLITAALMFLLQADIDSKLDRWLKAESVPNKVYTGIIKEHGIYKGLDGDGELDAKMNLLEAKMKHEVTK